MKRGNIFILSAPSGAGKSSVLSSLIEMEKNITTSVSHTTREPRGNEKNGLDYYFVSKSRFLEMAEDGEFLEFAEVFGNLYGTSKKAIAEKQEKGLDVILEIDWQGANQLMALDSDITSILLPNSDLNLGLGATVGKKLIGIGKVNPTHPEQWQFVDRPIAIQQFFGADHGLSAEGAQASYLLPVEFFSQVELGLIIDIFLFSKKILKSENISKPLAIIITWFIKKLLIQYDEARSLPKRK